MRGSCSADTAVREMSAAGTKKRLTTDTNQAIAGPFALFIAALKEIFEESAYERFLARSRVASSPAAYSDFLRETEAAKARRPKCC